MKINISLSTDSIGSAIRKLQDVLDNIEHGVAETVEILTNEGAETAQAAYGSWGVEAVPHIESDESFKPRSTITVIGDMPLIAEFGAGDTTIDPLTAFENPPDTEVFAGSYSLLEGSQEYWTYGSWHFGGARYDHVEPHLGLSKAKQYIIDQSTNVALGAIKL